MLSSSCYAIIMAGGIGSRFWPHSRKAQPKQFLDFFGTGSLIQATLGRLQGFIPPENCFVVTHERYVEATQRQLPALPKGNILAEPISRNTAPCIAFSAHKLQALDPNATMIVLPADHVIQDVAQFHRVLETAVDKAQETKALVTIGIEPTHPETGYGYIQFDGTLAAFHDERPQAFAVKTFAEKPNLATAERFIDSRDFLWNSGMFIWQASAILQQIEHHTPRIARAFAPLAEAWDTPHEADAIRTAFTHAPKISIDYGVMEKADEVYVVPGSFGWSDAGDWRAVHDLSDKDAAANATQGNAILMNAHRCLIQAPNRLVALVDLNDVVVVDTDDAVLICHRESTQQVKNVVEYLDANQLTEYT